MTKGKFICTFRRPAAKKKVHVPKTRKRTVLVVLFSGFFLPLNCKPCVHLCGQVSATSVPQMLFVAAYVSISSSSSSSSSSRVVVVVVVVVVDSSSSNSSQECISG